MADMTGQVALVTGGTRGIGLAICERLMDRGIKVAAGFAGGHDHAQQFAEKYADRGVSIHQGNIGSNGDCMRVMARSGWHGHLGIPVNNAGMTVDKTVRKMAPEEWEHVDATRCQPVRHVLHVPGDPAAHARPLLRPDHQHLLGHRLGPRVRPGRYAAAKSGLFGLTMSLALQTATRASPSTPSPPATSPPR